MPQVPLTSHRWFRPNPSTGQDELVAEAVVIYNDANRRLQSVDWQVFVNNVACYPRVLDATDPQNKVVLWEPPNQVPYTFGSGTETIPGNIPAEEFTGDGDPYWDLPSWMEFNVVMWTMDNVPA